MLAKPPTVTPYAHNPVESAQTVTRPTPARADSFSGDQLPKPLSGPS
jgi:hypothetical protein